MKLPKGSTSDLVSKSLLTKKESKRTTFKLSNKCLEAFEWMVESYNATAKEVLDIISLSDEIIDHAIEIAKEHNEDESQKKTRKTFVISKQSLSQLNRISTKENVSRDTLIEMLILLYKSLLEKHLEEEKEKEKEALKIISNFWSEAENVEGHLDELLSEENPIRDRFGLISIITGNLYSAIKSKLSDGTPVDPDDLSQQ